MCLHVMCVHVCMYIHTYIHRNALHCLYMQTIYKYTTGSSEMQVILNIRIQLYMCVLLLHVSDC